MENILMRIAREANRSGDAKTLFHALDLLERLMPNAPGRVDAFMAFCAELETEGDGWKARRRLSATPKHTVETSAIAWRNGVNDNVDSPDPPRSTHFRGDGELPSRRPAHAAAAIRSEL